MVEHGAPALVVAPGGVLRLGGEDLPAGVLELDPRAVALRGEAHLEPRRAAVVMAGVPGHRELRGRLPHEHAAPLALAAVGVPLEDPAADLFLDDDLGDL